MRKKTCVPILLNLNQLKWMVQPYVYGWDLTWIKCQNRLKYKIILGKIKHPKLNFENKHLYLSKSSSSNSSEFAQSSSSSRSTIIANIWGTKTNLTVLINKFLTMHWMLTIPKGMWDFHSLHYILTQFVKNCWSIWYLE